jgi:hypothetical protein
MKELELKTTLPAIGFNFDELKSWALGITEQYEGLVVREEDIAGIKSEMAGLNKMKKSLGDARKETVRKVSEPIKSFEGQIKEVCGIFDQAYAFLGGQVKKFEDQAREEKRTQVQFMIDSLVLENNLPGLVVPIQDEWLNKSKAMKDVKGAIEGIILAHIKAERDKEEFEKAKASRVALIRAKIEEKGAEYGFGITIENFSSLFSLEVPESQVAAVIDGTFRSKSERLAMESEVVKNSVPIVTNTGFVPPTPPISASADKSLLIKATFDPAKEEAINAAVRHLQSLCNTFARS